MPPSQRVYIFYQTTYHHDIGWVDRIIYFRVRVSAFT